MRSFQVACIALAAASASALTSYASESALGGSAYSLGGPSYSTGYTQAPAAISYAAAAPASYGIASAAPISYGIAAPAPISYGIASAAPAQISYGIASAAPAQISYGIAAPAAAPAYTQIAPTGPTYTQIAAAAGPAQVKSHEVHTTSGRQAIRIDEIQAGDQVIRVHEQPQAAPQIAQIQVPGEQHHVRVINHQSGPAEVQRVVQRQQTQVYDLQKPGRAGARIVQVVRGESPAPTVEFVSAGGSSHHVYQANDVQAAAPSNYASSLVATYAHAPVATYGTAPVATYAAGPVATYAAAPIAATYSGLGSNAYGSSYAAPSYTTSYTSGSGYQALPSTIALGSSSGAGSYGSTAVLSKA